MLTTGHMKSKLHESYNEVHDCMLLLSPVSRYIFISLIRLFDDLMSK